MRLFTVTDTETNKFVMQGATIPMLARHYGLSPEYITSAMAKGEKIQGKYLIEPIGLREEPKNTNSIPVALWKDWDEVCGIAKLIKEGKAHIVSKNIAGRRKRHTEVNG